MSRYTICVAPHASLFIGGYSHAGGESDGDTAQWQGLPIIPGATLKGALRESAARLTNAVDAGDLLATLFGGDGVEGLIRVGPLQPETGPAGAAVTVEPSVRNHVSLDRARRQAAPQRLFQNRVTPAVPGMRFIGTLTTSRPLDPDEEGLLQAASQLTDQIGGGRGRGLGLVTLTITRAETEATTEQERQQPGLTVSGDRAEVLLVLEALEPLQLGRVKDETNLQPSHGSLEGSALRGAVAAALSAITGEDEQELVLGGDEPVVFGDGHPGHATAIPAPMTLRKPKGGAAAGAPCDLALSLCAAALLDSVPERPHDTDAVRNTVASGMSSNGWTEVGLKRRIITRTARNHINGRAADGLLYSLEVIDPVLATPEVSEDTGLRFFCPVTGTPEQLDLVLRAARHGLAVGSARSRGFGRLALVEVIEDAGIGPPDERHRRWIECLERDGVDRKAAESSGVVLALGPIAVDQQRLLRTFAAAGLELIDGVSWRRPGGGWNARAGLPRTLSSQLAPGSTFIVRSAGGGSALAGLIKLEQKGIGPGRPDGWGRVITCHPIHIDCGTTRAAQGAGSKEG